MADVHVNAKVFSRRLNRLLSAWKSDGPDGVFRGADLLAICVGKADEDKSYQKSSVLQLWFFGFEFPDTLILIAKNRFAILTSQKKATILEELKKSGANVDIVVKGKEDLASNKIKDLMNLLKDDVAGKKVGIVEKDQYDGELFKDWNTFADARLEKTDVALAFADVLAVKDDDALTDLRVACDITSCFLRNHLVDRLENVIDEEVKITHAKLAEELDTYLSNPKCLKKIKAPEVASTDLVDWAFPPIIQSGGRYDLKPSAISDEGMLHFGTVLCAIGTRYNSYCSNIARTYLISPTKEQEENYRLLCDVHQLVISSLKERVELKQVYAGALKLVGTRKPALQGNFTKNCGFGIGLEFKESSFLIGPKSEAIAAVGMVFNVVVGFQDLRRKAGSERAEDTYALLLADTVEITKAGPRVLTEAKAKLDDISYVLEEDGGDREPAKMEVDAPPPKQEKPRPKEPAAAAAEKPKDREKDREKGKERAPEQDKGKEKAKKERDDGAGGRKQGRDRNVLMESRTRDNETNKEQERLEKIRELFERRTAEAKERYGDDKDKKASDKAVVKKVESYKKASDMPVETKSGQIYVDSRRETVILPIFGYAVPFHITMIKNPSYTAPAGQGGEGYLRINFVTPGRAAKDQANVQATAETHFVGEMTYRSEDVRHLEEAAKLIRELKKVNQEREQKRKELEDLVEQPKLVEGKGAVLRDVLMRPALESKRIPGALIIHKNGLRYQSNTGKRIDVIFSNIKHLIFQPCEKEVLVLIHIRLRHPIMMLDKKKTTDLQFYREVVDAAVDETGSRRRVGMDRDEIEEEEEERRNRKRQNKEFKDYAQEIAERSDGLVELDEPFRDLGFFGVPARSNVFMQPTAYCLVHLTEPPHFIVTMEEVELVYFERIEHGLKNFDMVFVFKDYKRAPSHVNTIPMKEFENIKDWLIENEIPYAEGKTNLAWPGIMKHINEDVAAFFEEGGWEFLFPSAQAEGEEEESESESEFEMSGESSESSSYSSSDASESSDMSTPSEDEGDDWDTQEEKAKKSDMRRTDLDDDDRKKKPMKKK